MKFRFCGGRDCPDWLLAEISTISRLTSIKAKLVCMKVVQALIAAQKEDQVPDPDKLSSLTADAKLSLADIQATVAALNFILTSAAKHDCDVESVVSELQQLGLPKEHSSTIGKVYGDNKLGIRNRQKEKSLKIGGNFRIANWSIEKILSSSAEIGPDKNIYDTNIVKLKLESRNSWGTEQGIFNNVSMTPLQLRVLLSDMRKAKINMEALS